MSNGSKVAANKWVTDHPEDVKLFREAFENRQMSNPEIAQMFNLPIYSKNGENSSSSPFVSMVAKVLGLNPKRVSTPHKSKETSFNRIERLKKELAEAQKEQLREANNDEAKIRKFVESMGGIANFQLKLRMIRWN